MAIAADAVASLEADRYPVILADPPWKFRNGRTGGSMRSGASQIYPTVATADLCRMPIPAIAARDAIGFLWATSPMLPDALEVLAAWGFGYRGLVVWSKATRAGRPFNGMGAWFRNSAELLIFGIRGRVPALRCQLPNVVHAPVGPHSAKPEAVWRLVEEAIGGREDLAPRLELFARGPPRPGWHAWGNETEDGIALPALDAWAAALPTSPAAPVLEGATA